MFRFVQGITRLLASLDPDYHLVTETVRFKIWHNVWQIHLHPLHLIYDLVQCVFNTDYLDTSNYIDSITFINRINRLPTFYLNTPLSLPQICTHVEMHADQNELHWSGWLWTHKTNLVQTLKKPFYPRKAIMQGAENRDPKATQQVLANLEQQSQSTEIPGYIVIIYHIPGHSALRAGMSYVPY